MLSGNAALKKHKGAMVLPAVALYRALTASGADAEDLLNAYGDAMGRRFAGIVHCITSVPGVPGLIWRHMDSVMGVIRYSFTQCPNAEFAKRHHLEDVLPVMCNCDHLAMRKLHASLIREGTCVESPCCDYCIVGDRHPLAQEYELVKKENGLLVSVKK